MAHPRTISGARVLGLSLLVLAAAAACSRDNAGAQMAAVDAAEQPSEIQHASKTDPEIARKLMQGEWRLVAIDQRQLRPGGTPTVVFGAEGSCWGSTGVNNFRTTFTLAGPDHNRVKVGPAAVTRKSGPPEALALENLFLQRFESASSFKVDGDTLHLNAGADQNLTFERVIN